ncbi:WSC domain-containing protein-like protein 1 [Phlyctema vagabunda]|uniref:Peroxidase n=1 Tax=Phlyctema vagabunda TaxID=108571 RepID=A0ABR4PA96_9HELO
MEFYVVLLFFSQVFSSGFAAFFYPDPQSSLLEHILVDVHGAHASNFSTAITPCSNYVSGAQTFGRTTAAQWIRVAFHDFVTADVATGVGGMDASIGFETLREEDSGSAFNDSLTFFRPYVNKEVSMADLIALSVVMSVGICGGPQIPLRAGRIDATEGGAFGVPAPETELDLTLEFFAGAGFDQVSAIGLTACGHTLGSVHHGGFPAVVGPEAVTPNNTAGGIHFDDTVAIFDSKVVNEYLDGTGNAGGPLVTSFNVSSRSDLRLYKADGNATMIELRNQGNGFMDTCKTLLQRMIDTVPEGVELGKVISPMDVKPINTTLDFDTRGNLILKGTIRTISTSSPSLILRSDYNKPLTLHAETSIGISAFGTTRFYPFNLVISPSTTSFNVAGETFEVQTRAFTVPSISTVSADGTSVLFTIAASQGLDDVPTVMVSAPLPQMGTLGPKVVGFDCELKFSRKLAGYDIYEGDVDFGDVRTGKVSIETSVDGGIVDVALL